jgi:hypothetical protein
MPQQPDASKIPGGPGLAAGYPAMGSGPVATPVYASPPCGPPPVPPPSAKSDGRTGSESSRQGSVLDVAPSASASEQFPQSIKTRKSRSLRRASQAKSSQLALMFLLAAAFFLVGVVIVLAISLAV